MFTKTQSNLNSLEKNTDYIVNDITEAEFGRKELLIAETEMPGLMALRKKYGTEKPLKGSFMFISLLSRLKALIKNLEYSKCKIACSTPPMY